MNKKLFYLGLFSIFMTFVLVGCKKGENDPALSLLSRKARITGKWILSSANYSVVTTDNEGTTTKTYSYDGTNMSFLNNGGNGVIYPYTEEVLIDKDGTFNQLQTEIRTYGQITIKKSVEHNGVWYFVDGNKQIEMKDKERVEFLYQQVIYTSLSEGVTQSTENNFEGASNSHTHLILLDRLANDEMIILLDETEDNGVETKTTSGIMTYSKTK